MKVTELTRQLHRVPSLQREAVLLACCQDGFVVPNTNPFIVGKEVDGIEERGSSELEVADAQSRAIEVVAKDIANSPTNFWRGKAEEQRIALLSIYLALIFGLMDQLRWRLERIEQQRETAELAKDKMVHREAVDVSERLRRALDVLAGQALDERVYVVRARPTTVRARPGSGLVLRTEYTKQQVLVTGKSSRWLKVRFRDHLEQLDIEGWVLKHYLQPLKKNRRFGYSG